MHLIIPEKFKKIRNYCLYTPPVGLYLIFAGSGLISLIYLILIVRSISNKNLKAKTVIIFIVALIVFVFLYWRLTVLANNFTYGELC